MQITQYKTIVGEKKPDVQDTQTSKTDDYQSMIMVSSLLSAILVFYYYTYLHYDI